jgi:hypothetical protein
MKICSLCCLVLIMPFGLSAQTIVTYQNNSLRVCDSNTYREIQYADPGNAGAGQLWDFSTIVDAGKNIVSAIQCAEIPKMNGVNDYSLLLDENGYEYFMSSGDKDLVEQGYVNKEQKLVLSYSDPVVKIKYPFAYGDQFTDHFKGVALYDETSSIELMGDITVSADGYGTLILPDRVIEGALRVKSVKQGLQVNMCGTNDFTITKYSWYASGFRYPVLNLVTTESRLNRGAPIITRSANTNIQQFIVKSTVLGMDILAQSKTSSSIAGKQEVKVLVSPNPFGDQLKFEYTLPGQMNVSIALFDGSGKSFASLVSNQQQAVGFHSGELNSSRYSLMPGIYFMRFSFDKQVASYKVVKF